MVVVVGIVRFWIEMREKKQAYYFAVEERMTGVFFGSCGLSGWKPEHRHAMLGYWIRTSRTGQGIATAAARHVACGELMKTIFNMDHS